MHNSIRWKIRSRALVYTGITSMNIIKVSPATTNANFMHYYHYPISVSELYTSD